jgi:hypothetical protein
LTFDRREALVRVAAVTLVGASGAALSAGRARADLLPDADLAYARVLVAAELLAINFYTRALEAKRFGPEGSSYLRRALFNEQEHYQSMSGVLSGAGLTPAVATDIDFSYPSGTFGSKGAIAKLGVQLETMILGAYLGAVDALQTNALKQPAARIAANEAQHLSAVSALTGGHPFSLSFPAPLSISQVSNVLDRFTS